MPVGSPGAPLAGGAAPDIRWLDEQQLAVVIDGLPHTPPPRGKGPKAPAVRRRIPADQITNFQNLGTVGIALLAMHLDDSTRPTLDGTFAQRA